MVVLLLFLRHATISTLLPQMFAHWQPHQWLYYCSDKNQRLVVINNIYHVKYSARNSIDKPERFQLYHWYNFNLHFYLYYNNYHLSVISWASCPLRYRRRLNVKLNVELVRSIITLSLATLVNSLSSKSNSLLSRAGIALVVPLRVASNDALVFYRNLGQFSNVINIVVIL